MAATHDPTPVKLVVGMLSAFPKALAAAEAELVRSWGRVDLKSPVMPHDFTDYYRDQMGEPLMRLLVSFERLIDPGELADIKRRTNAIEEELAAANPWPVARPVNLDPGYVTPAKLVLASCKDYTHRIYLRGGVYAETTLGYTGGRWTVYDWTYPDYRTAAYHEFLDGVRRRLMAQQKEDGLA